MSARNAASNSISKNKAVAELWRRSSIYWKLSAPQTRIYDWLNAHSSRRIVLLCHRQFGKSFFLCLYAIEFALKNPGSEIFYIAETQKQVRGIILKRFREILRDCPDDLKPKFNHQDGEWVFPNGSKVIVAGGDSQIDRLRGRTASLCILDEAGFQQQLEDLVDNVLHPATLHTQGKIIFSSTPPKTLAHGFIQYLEHAERVDAVFKFKITENEDFTEKDIKAEAELCGGFDSVKFRREYLCEIIQDTKMTIVPEWKDEFVQEPDRDEFFKYYHRYEGMDLGFQDLTVCLFGYYDFRKATLYIEDELAVNKHDGITPLLAGSIREKEHILWNDSRVYRRIADNNEQRLLADLGTFHGLNFVPTNKDSLEAMVNEVRMWIQQGRIRVSPRCKQLLGCLKFGIWNDKRTEFARSKAYGHQDALAALMYLVRNIDTHSNPIPVTHGIQSRDDVFVPPDSQQSQSIEAFRQIFNIR